MKELLAHCLFALFLSAPVVWPLPYLRPDSVELPAPKQIGVLRSGRKGNPRFFYVDTNMRAPRRAPHPQRRRTRVRFS